MYCAEALGTLDEAEYDRIVSELLLIPTKLEQILDNRADIQYFASLYFNHPSIFFIGRNIDYAIGMEGSLKLKEISYIHSEAYAAGELKHGTIALIEKGRPVIALSGVGNPKPFVQTLRERYEVVAEMTLDDHHVYKVRDMNALAALLEKHPGAVIVTTEKDAVKMTNRAKIPARVRSNLYYLPINISFIEDSATDFLQKLEEDVRGN